ICFLPQPTNGGLPDGSIPDLQDRLRVYLTTKDGSKQLLQLPITSAVQSLEPNLSGFSKAKGNKLILYVAEGSSRPAWSGYDRALGLIEQPIPVRTPARELPQSVLAYQAVDAVVWINGDARVLSEQGSTQLAALQQWVRQGGMLVVCNPSSDGARQNIAPFAGMLPIEWQDNGQWKVTVKNRTSLEPLPTLAAWKGPSSNHPAASWNFAGEFPFAHAIPKPNAVVDTKDWIVWDKEGKDKSPYIARIPYGLGSVTWVANDVGDPKITGPKATGWPYIWDEIFGWKNDTHVAADITKQNEDEYNVEFMTPPIDLGAAQLAGVEFRSKGAGLIGLAVLFFVIYWLIAGPGMYFFLASRKQKELNWTVFGVTAMAATLLTVLVVRLVLRGSPEVHHATDVRMVSGQAAQPAIAYSRIGLYIPRDGSQRVSLADTSAEFVSYVTPMSIYPSYVPDNEFPANLDYSVPVREEGTTSPIGIDVPFRSTLKKLQAKWCGDISKTVRANDVHLNPDDNRFPILGTLDNLTGLDLKNVYIAFHYNNDDYILYLPFWSGEAGKNRIDLKTQYGSALSLPLGGIVRDNPNAATPEDQKPCAGVIKAQWSYYWAARLKSAGERVEDLDQAVPISFPVLSFFDRIPPSRKDDTGIKALTLLRRGARNLNMSQALAAGELVVLAQASNQPLPFPFQVNGDRIDGAGTVFYQFALPLDQGNTQPEAAK
ncbi:MAG TPA: hypothetical protein VN541_11280, partial [Tepidisphaeraceae bacterium]|nr:hypothetical protein [Tepidisphaeraceae bacterium]